MTTALYRTHTDECDPVRYNPVFHSGHTVLIPLNVIYYGTFKLQFEVGTNSASYCEILDTYRNG
jgi:hypothetical protein